MRPKFSTEEKFKRFRDSNIYVGDKGTVYHQYSNSRRYLKGHNDSTRGKHNTRVHVLGRNYSLARLVYETWVGEIPSGYMVYHRNGCASMNDVGNLAIKTRNDLVKTINKKHKWYIDLKTKKIYGSQRKMAKELGTTHSTISNVCNGKFKSDIVNVAYYCRINNKAFRGNYEKYIERMEREYDRD